MKFQLISVTTRLFGYDQGITGGILDLPSFTKYFPDINPKEEGITAAVKLRAVQTKESQLQR